MAWITLDELKTDLRARGEDGSGFDDEQLQQVLNAAVEFVQRVRPGFSYPTVPEIGDSIPLSIEVRDGDGLLINPVAITLEIELPDGQFTELIVPNPPASVGVFETAFTVMQAGAYVARWFSIGPALAHASTFAVRGLSGLPAPTADLKLGTLRLAGRWHTRRRSPDGLIEGGNEFGRSRVPSFDPDIDRLLGIGRFRGPVIA